MTMCLTSKALLSKNSLPEYGITIIIIIIIISRNVLDK